MSDIYRKTPLGFEEIANRAGGLSAKLRRCLILINGQRTVAELMFMMLGENVLPMVQTLAARGFIEKTDLTAGVLFKVENALETGVTQVLSSMDTVFSDEALPINPALMFKDSEGKLRVPLAFADRKQRAVRAVNDLLGPEAENVALKIELCKIDAELNVALRSAAAFIEGMISPVAAQKFKDYVRLSGVV